MPLGRDTLQSLLCRYKMTQRLPWGHLPNPRPGGLPEEEHLRHPGRRFCPTLGNCTSCTTTCRAASESKRVVTQGRLTADISRAGRVGFGVSLPHTGTMSVQCLLSVLRLCNPLPLNVQVAAGLSHRGSARRAEAGSGGEAGGGHAQEVAGRRCSC